MRIRIIGVGRIKEKFFTQAVAEYEKRLGRYCHMEITEVPDEAAPQSASASEETKIKAREGERILKTIREDEYVIALEIRGKMLDSEELAGHLETLMVGGRDRITFVIGGSLGLSEDVLKRADFRLSFSRMTFPHQLMRVILAEQIYRAFRILNHEPYHK